MALDDRIVIVRCPRCGSTDARGVDGWYEFTEMVCGFCGNTEMCDEWQIKMDWNVWVLREQLTELPPAWTPDVVVCDHCRLEQGPPETKPLHGATATRVCVHSCQLCYQEVRGALVPVGRTMSRVLTLLSKGELSAKILANLVDVPDFDWKPLLRELRWP